MQVNLHKNARTTPAIRRELRESPLPIAELARRYNLSQATVRKWRRREDGADRSHRPHLLHTTLSPAQEAVVVALRQTLLLPLDDLLAVTREFLNAAVSRSGLDRCLRRQGVSDLKALLPRDESGKPVSIETMSYTINKVQSELTVLVNNTLNKNMLSSAKIPLGSLTDSYLMAGKGPKIPLRICPEGEADVKLTGQFTSAGLNQTCHSISAVITVNMESSLPLYSFDTKSEFEFLIAQTVIVGDVPDNILGSASGCKNSESRN